MPVKPKPKTKTKSVKKDWFETFFDDMEKGLNKGGLKTKRKIDKKGVHHLSIVPPNKKIK